MANLDDIPRVEERVGRALSRGDLRQRETACDLDKIAALGAVGIEEKLADAVFRLKYANDPKAYEDAREGVRCLARNLDNRHRMRLRSGRLDLVVRRVLDYWLADICALCSGVGYEIIHNSPHLSDRACPACEGTRKRAMPWLRRIPHEPEGRRATRARRLRWRRGMEQRIRMMAFHRALLCELEEVERRIGAKVIAKLSQDARF